MKGITYFSVVFLIFFVLDLVESRHVIQERSVLDQLSLITKITDDMSKGDLIASLIDSISFVENMRQWAWPLKLLFRFLRWFLGVIHPLCLWVMQLFSSNNTGGLTGNIQNVIKASADTLRQALSFFHTVLR